MYALLNFSFSFPTPIIIFIETSTRGKHAVTRYFIITDQYYRAMDLNLIFIDLKNHKYTK